MAPRLPGDTLPGNSEEALRARGDLLLLLVRGALTPEDIAEAFIPPQHLLRTIRRDAVVDDATRRRLKQWCFQQGQEIPELPAMSERRARVYSALYEDLNMTHLLQRPSHVTHKTVEERRVLEYFQKRASDPKRDSTSLVHKALEPWITGRDENLIGRQFQEARQALGLYLFELHDSLLEDIKGLPPNDKRLSMQEKTRIPVFEKAMKDVHAKRIATQSPKERQIGAAHQIIAAAFVDRRSREAAQRLAEALAGCGKTAVFPQVVPLHDFR